jgi:hypothetical protein
VARHRLFSRRRNSGGRRGRSGALLPHQPRRRDRRRGLRARTRLAGRGQSSAADAVGPVPPPRPRQLRPAFVVLSRAGLHGRISRVDRPHRARGVGRGQARRTIPPSDRRFLVRRFRRRDEPLLGRLRGPAGRPVRGGTAHPAPSARGSPAASPPGRRSGGRPARGGDDATPAGPGRTDREAFAVDQLHTASFIDLRWWFPLASALFLRCGPRG